ncbi:MAG: polysaccharide pyruvyl transferase family protein [Proteobacteria bacterium]|nr:polysaccharide pyruvyl transferase family protein [Pseudomonadota bacterium]
MSGWAEFGTWAKKRVRKGLDAADADRALIASMAAGIEFAATRSALDRGAVWKPGTPLKLLLAGYSGTRNTGADVRVEEMIKQLRHLFGDDWLELSLLTVDPERSRGYFRTVRQLTLPKIFPKFLVQTVHEHHGVLACEGSMFKSKFANALSTMMTGALGLANAEGKISVAYGGEAGSMDTPLAKLVRDYASESLMLVRNQNSREVLGALGIDAFIGTDTAWTYDPGPVPLADELLADAGYTPGQKLVICCPINAFWWPVKPDVAKGVSRWLTGAHRDTHYASVYFHKGGSEVDAKQAAYIENFARAIKRYAQQNDAFVAIVGMEAVDRIAGEALAELLGGAPVWVSDDHVHTTLVGLLRRADRVVTSRYHAAVTCMPANTPSIGITMDERIPNLMADRGHPELALRVDDPTLDEALFDALNWVDAHEESVRDGILDSVVRNLERMGQMGQQLVDRVRAHHPEFPFRAGLGTGTNAWDHLPPLHPALADAVARHRERNEDAA